MSVDPPPDCPVDERDFSVFAKNVEATRKILGLTIRDLAAKAHVGVNTLIRIHRGEPCTPRIQLKVAIALNAYVDTLWETNVVQPPRYFIFDETNTRWYFAEQEDAVRWPLNDAPGRDDPDSIQSQAERLRLGVANLSKGFVGSHSCYLPSGYQRAGLVEVCGYQEFDSSIAGDHDVYHYCLRGSLRVFLGEETFIFTEGQALIFDGTLKYAHEPLSRIKSTDSPPLLLWVALNIRPTHPSRKG